MGIPHIAQTDQVKIYINDKEQECDVPLVIQPKAPDYIIVSAKQLYPSWPILTDFTTAAESDHYQIQVTLLVYSPGPWGIVSSENNGYSFAGSGNIADAQGYNPLGKFPQTVIVTGPVAVGQADVYGTGKDVFTISTTTSATPSNASVDIYLTEGGISIDPDRCEAVILHGLDNLKVGQAIPTDSYIDLPINVNVPCQLVVYARVSGLVFKSTPDPIAFTKNTSSVRLYPTTTPQAPTTPGDFPIAFTASNAAPWTTEKNSLVTVPSTCTPSVTVKPSKMQMAPGGLKFVSYNGTGTAFGYGGGSSTVHVTNPVSDKETGGIYTIDPYVSSDLTVQHPRDNAVTSITIEATASIPGDYDYSITLNGITYAKSGTVTTAGTYQITLTSTGTLTDYNQKVVSDDIEYYTTGDDPTLGTPSGRLTIPMSFVYRPMKVLSLGPRNYVSDRPFPKGSTKTTGTSSANWEIWNEANFGPLPTSTKFVGDFVVHNGIGSDSLNLTQPTAQTLSNSTTGKAAFDTYLASQKPDIIYLMADVLNDLSYHIASLADFVNNKGGVLIISSYHIASSASLFNAIYGISTFTGTSVATATGTADFTTVASLTNRIVPAAENDILLNNGPFKPDPTTWNNSSLVKYLADDVGDGRGVLISKLPPTLKPIAYRSGTSSDATDYAFIVRDTDKGFVWSGDYGWANGQILIGPAATRIAYPNYIDSSGIPTQPGLYSGSRYIYNNIAFCNSFAWAIDYAALHRVP
jgi:hypothetical protein